jgi:hypothetical protein
MIVYLCYEDFMEAVPTAGVEFTIHETENLACVWAVEQAHEALESYRESTADDPLFEPVPDALMHRLREAEDGSYVEVEFYHEDADRDEPAGRFTTFVIERLPLNEVEVDADSH